MRCSLPLKLLPFAALALTQVAPSAGLEQVANLNISSKFAEANGCGEVCQRNLRNNSLYDLHVVGTQFDTRFYQTASNFTGSRPGDLLKLQPVDPATLNVKSGTTVYRLQYTSLDLDGKTPVPATGFIAFPYAPLAGGRGSGDKNKYRSVAFAHGTVGIYRGCAPSAGPALFDYDSWKMLVDSGYAVIATDYAGLGNNHTQHKYCSFPVHVNDVYFSMVAARKAFGHVLTREWMSIGHSQGGGAVWKLSESQYVKKDTKYPYIGTVALAPATHIIDMFSSIVGTSPDTSNNRSLSIFGYTPFLALAYQRFRPSYNLTILGPQLRQRMAIAEKAQTCAAAFMGLTQDLAPRDLISMEALRRETPQFLEWQRQVSPASGDRSLAPVLVVQGLNDTSVLTAATRNACEQACKSRSEIHLSVYPGLEHSPLLPGSAPEWLGWMDARFAGKKTTGRCSSVMREPFGQGAFMKLPAESDI